MDLESRPPRDVTDNPLYLANQKAKRLKSLLQGQRALDKYPVPDVHAIVFLSAKDLSVKLLPVSAEPYRSILSSFTRGQGVMRMVAFIPEGRVIHFILDHLGVAARRGAKGRAGPGGTLMRNRRSACITGEGVYAEAYPETTSWLAASIR